jgi:hypothetical protein
MYDTQTYLMHKEGDEGAKQTQNNWLKEDMKKANEERHIRPWVIALAHHPLYCSEDWTRPESDILGSSD